MSAVYQLEQCQARLTMSARTVQCELRKGHDGHHATRHAAWTDVWELDATEVIANSTLTGPRDPKGRQG